MVGVVADPSLSQDTGAESPPPEDPDPAGPSRPAKRPRATRRVAVEWLVVIAATIGLTLIIKTFLVEAFVIPTGSMEPTLKAYNRVLVEKVGYTLHRGDMIVFNEPPADTEVGTPRLVKRIIGLPGDVVSAEGGSYYIDGRRLNESWLPKVDRGVTCAPGTVPPSCGSIAPITVPKGDYFVSGDNRTDSYDSRYFGPISGKLIVGKVFFKIWPLSEIDLY
jgi:signal peptidase I